MCELLPFFFPFFKNHANFNRLWHWLCFQYAFSIECDAPTPNNPSIFEYFDQKWFCCFGYNSMILLKRQDHYSASIKAGKAKWFNQKNMIESVFVIFHFLLVPFSFSLYLCQSILFFSLFPHSLIWLKQNETR